jgi:hypothetical protein
MLFLVGDHGIATELAGLQIMNTRLVH